VSDPGGRATAASPASCALVILSCDAYRDLWRSCLTLYRRYWPDCPYPMFLVSETQGLQDARVRSVCAGPGLAWSDVVRAALGRLEHELVLLMLDDFFLAAPVGTPAVEARRLELAARGGAHFRLVPAPGPSARVPGARDFGEHLAGAPYRASLQAAFWRRGALLDLLRPGESPWEFERRGSVRSAALAAPFYASRRALIPYVDALRQGRWSRRGLRLCRREGLPVDLEARPRSSGREALAEFRVLARRVAAGPVSWRLRRALRRLAGDRPGRP
jgi:hypothetical protein